MRRIVGEVYGHFFALSGSKSLADQSEMFGFGFVRVDHTKSRLSEISQGSGARCRRLESVPKLSVTKLHKRLRKQP